MGFEVGMYLLDGAAHGASNETGRVTAHVIALLGIVSGPLPSSFWTREIQHECRDLEALS